MPAKKTPNVDSAKSGKATSSVGARKRTPKSVTPESDEGVEEKENVKVVAKNDVKPVKRGAGRKAAPPKKKESSDEESEPEASESKSESEEEKPRGKGGAKRKLEKSTKPADDESDASEAKPKKAAPKKKAAKKENAPKKESASKKGAEYSADALEDKEVERINSVMETLASKTLPQLKAMLSNNSLKITGTKAELLERIGESTVLGCLPKCEMCGGNLRWNKDDGMYSCPGKYEDGAMKRCSFKSEQVDRIPWKA